MPPLFISYRRADGAGHVRGLVVRLRREFGPSCVFVDLDVPGGTHLREILTQLLGARVVIVVMGDRWLQETPSGPNRLFDRDDWVRAELELALEERKKIAPVLLSSVRMPKPADLPEPIRPFASIKAFELSDTRYEYDLGQLVGRLAPYVPAAMADAGRGIQKIDWRSFGWEGVLDASPEKVLRLAEMALREHFAGTDLKKKKLRIQGVVKYPGTFTDNSYLTVTAEPRGTQARTVIHSKRYTLWEGRSDREGKNVSEMLAWFRQAGVRSV